MCPLTRVHMLSTTDSRTNRTAMSEDLFTDLSLPLTPSDCSDIIPGAAAGDAAPLKIYGLSFLCPLPAFNCTGYIGQDNPYPSGINTITVTMATAGGLPVSNDSLRLLIVTTQEMKGYQVSMCMLVHVYVRPCVYRYGCHVSREPANLSPRKLRCVRPQRIQHVMFSNGS